jgi:hypothetical protein
VLFQPGVAEVPVDGLAADPIVTGKEGFRYIAAGPLDQSDCPFRCEGLFPSLVSAALLGQGDAFPLAFPDEGAFEFGEGAHDGEHEVGHGESSPVKTRLSLTNSTRTPCLSGPRPEHVSHQGGARACPCYAPPRCPRRGRSAAVP